MEDQWRIAKYDPAWRDLFLEIGSKLREALGKKAVRIDQVGSTSIVGMDAKPIIDIQISVPSMKICWTTNMRSKQSGLYLEQKTQIRLNVTFVKNPETEGYIYTLDRQAVSLSR